MDELASIALALFVALHDFDVRLSRGLQTTRKKSGSGTDQDLWSGPQRVAEITGMGIPGVHK